MTDDTPSARFDAYLAQVERDPDWQARQDRIRRVMTRRPLYPFYGGPAVGLGIVALLLLARWIGWIG